MEPEEWESDGEFEATITDMENNESCGDSISMVSVTSTVKTELPHLPSCSTPKVNDTHPGFAASVSSISFANSPPNTDIPCAPTIQPAISASKRKRKFPGPAGTLPKLKRHVDLHSLKNVRVQIDQSEDDHDEDIVSSQSSQPLNASSYATWRRLVEEMELSKDHLQKHSISNALSNACKRQLPDGKVPLLVAVIININKSLPDATVTLKDLTGTVNGIIHRLLVKQHHEHLKVGSALLLKHVAVFSPSRRRQYLNITPNNLLQVYSEDDKSAEVQSTTVTELSVPLETLLTQPVSCSPKPEHVEPTLGSRPNLLNTVGGRYMSASYANTYTPSKVSEHILQRSLTERVNGISSSNNKLHTTELKKPQYSPTNMPNKAIQVSNQNVAGLRLSNQSALNNKVADQCAADNRVSNQEMLGHRLTNRNMVDKSTPNVKVCNSKGVTGIVTAAVVNNINHDIFDDDDLELDDLDLDF